MLINLYNSKFDYDRWTEMLTRFIHHNNIINNNDFNRKQLVIQSSLFDSRPHYVCLLENNMQYNFTDNFRVDAYMELDGLYNQYTFILYDDVYSS